MSEYEYETIDEDGDTWPEGVRKVATHHPVLGGDDESPLNVSAKDLAVRTALLSGRAAYTIGQPLPGSICYSLTPLVESAGIGISPEEDIYEGGLVEVPHRGYWRVGVRMRLTYEGSSREASLVAFEGGLSVTRFRPSFPFREEEGVATEAFSVIIPVYERGHPDSGVILIPPTSGGNLSESQFWIEWWAPPDF